MEEVKHLINVLEDTKKALKEEDAFRLKELSNQTIHSVSAHQDTGNITMAVIVYALSKLVERKASLKIKNWDSLIKKIEYQAKLNRMNKIKHYLFI